VGVTVKLPWDGCEVKSNWVFAGSDAGGLKELRAGVFSAVTIDSGMIDGSVGSASA
jgi:hypothetical protein